MNRAFRTTLIALLAALLALPAAAQGPARSYLILGRGNRLPANLAQRVADAGGTLVRSVPEVGIAIASSSASDFQTRASGITGVEAVAANPTMRMIDPQRQEAVAVDFGNPPSSGDDDFFFDLQWGHDAVDSPGAWAAGARGDGVRIAILDTGFDLDHPDLAPNINFALSIDFTGEGLSYALPDPLSHGSWTAGIAAAADNAFGTIGVAPEAELLLIKVLDDEGNGSFGDIVSGIVYAANNGADVISMSIAARMHKSGFIILETGEIYYPNEVAELKNAVGRATTYANQRGSTVIAAAGNDGEDFDHTNDAFSMPSGAPHVLSISATGPQGWAVDPTTDLDVPAWYTNFGQSTIDFAAPGGNVDFDLLDSGAVCTVVLTRPCWVFDLVLSTGSSLDPAIAQYHWGVGTSASAPHVAGVAAIIIGLNGGDMKPSLVEAALRAAADDLGKPGNDDFFGGGRVNAGNAAE